MSHKLNNFDIYFHFNKGENKMADLEQINKHVKEEILFKNDLASYYNSWNFQTYPLLLSSLYPTLVFMQAQPKMCHSPKVEEGVENQFFPY